MANSKLLTWAGLAAVILSAIVFELDADQLVRAGCVTGVLTGLFLMRLSRVRDGARTADRPNGWWIAGGIAAALLLAGSFLWLFLAASVGRYDVDDVWFCVFSSAVFGAYLFGFFILRKR